MLFKRELKRNFKSFLIITLVCALMVFYIISMAPAFGTDIQKILDLKMPGGMQKAFGMKDLNFSKPNSFFAMSFSYIYLFFSLYVSGVFAIIVSKEFSEKTAEYLFSLPAKRINIIFTKLALAGLYALLSVIFIFLAAWLSFTINIGEGFDLIPVILMALAWLIGGLTFGAIAFMLSSFFTRSRTISALTLGFVMAMYMLQVIISFNSALSFLKYISPFDWFKGSEIANTGEISPIYCFIALGIMAVCFYIGIRRFKKMDVLI